MAKRVFTEEERAEYREKMLDAGFDLLKKYGMKIGRASCRERVSVQV